MHHMATTHFPSAADILVDVIRPTNPSFAAEFAANILNLRLSPEAADRLRELLQRNNAGTLTPEERDSLEKHLLVGQFIDLMQAKARLSLQAKSAPA